MDENNKNFMMAIVLSIGVLLAWQFFFAAPREKEQKARQQAQTQTQQDTLGGSSVPQPGSVPGTPQPSQSSVQGAPNAPGAQIAPAPAGATRAAALAASPRIAIETPSLKGSIALKGARIDDLILNKYKQTTAPGAKNVTLFSPSGSAGAYYAEHGWVGNGTASLKLPTSETLWQVRGANVLKPGTPVTLQWDNGAGLVFKRTITLDEGYMFSIRQEVQNKTGSAISLFPYALISRHDTPDVRSFYILHEGLVGVLGEDGLQEIDYGDALEDKVTTFRNARGGWLGITDKYWAAVIVPNQKTSFEGRFSGSVSGGKERYQVDYLREAVTIQPGAGVSVEGELFAGAKETHIIDAYADKFSIDRFDLLIDWGWFYFLTKPMFFAIDYFFKLVGNFGLSILIVTIIIKLALFPLANKSYVSMSKMKKLQPEMAKLKERFGDDKARQQQALMELYKKEKVNPASGCLPILVQIPIFFSLYKVLFVTIEMRHAPFYGWIKDLSAPDPTTVFNLFGLIPWTPPSFLMIGVWPLIMGVTMLVQMRLNPAPPDPIQAKIFAWMPVIFTFMLAPFPAGLVIYWAWNNLLSVTQQAFIMKRQGVDIALFDNLGLTKKKNTGTKGKS